MIGRTLSHYRVLEKLGEGGMGEVYLALDTELRREVALKVLPSGVAADPDRLERFRREARAVAALDHPNVVTIHAVEEAEGIRFFTMERVEGPTLGALIPSGGLSLPRFFELAVPLADALAAAHDKGITHRDVKPGNVMVAPGGQVKVLDFGLARLQVASDAAGLSQLSTEAKTGEGALVGTLPYMAPELLEGRTPDPRSDVFALGVVFYQMLTGAPPFRGPTAAALVSAILRDRPAPATTSRSDLPEDLARVLERCLDKDPGRRYATAAPLRDDLRHSQPAVHPEKTSLDTSGVSPAPTRARRVSRPLLAGLAVLAAGIATGLLALRPWSRVGNEPDSIRSLAVLPLDNLTGDEGQEYFVDGMTEALIADLSRIRSLKVISRTSAMRYKDSDRSLPEIAGELGVDGIVEGSVLRAGNRVRITTQLIDARTERNVWGESYQREVTDIIALQADVARAIAQAVQAAVSPEEQRHLIRAATVDPEAHEAYLRGRALWARGGDENEESGLVELRRAVEIDPDYALAHAGLADAFLTLAHSSRPAREAMPLAKQSARRALELDPDLAEAHAALADGVFHYDWDWAGSEREFVRALELNPGYATGHWWYAGLLAALGRSEEATREIQRAQELSPLQEAINFFAVAIYRWARLPDRAQAEARRIQDRTGRDWGVLMTLPDDQRPSPPLLDRIQQTDGCVPLARFAVISERVDQARECLRRLEEQYGSDFVSPMGIATGYAFLDEREAALRWLEEAHRTRAADLVWIEVEPAFDRLRAEPRFQDILADMAFPG